MLKPHLKNKWDNFNNFFRGLKLTDAYGDCHFSYFTFQELIFSGFSIASYTTDVQTVDITSSGYFRLGLYGVYTGTAQIHAMISFFTSLSRKLYELQHNKTNKMICAPSKDSDHPGHPPSLIRVFTVRSMVAKDQCFFM